MRILFMLPGKFAPLGHAIARRLQELYEISGFAALTYTNASARFLKTQRDIHYEPLLSDSDIYRQSSETKIDLELLSQLERDYGLPTLWPYIVVDRSLFLATEGHPSYRTGYRLSLGRLQKLLQAHFIAVRRLLEEAQPDFVVGNSPGHMGTLILAHMAKAWGIPTLFFGRTRLLNRVTIAYDPYESFSKIFTLYESIRDKQTKGACRDEAARFLEQFRSTRLFYEGSRAQQTWSDLRSPSLIKEGANLLTQGKNIVSTAYGQILGVESEKPYPSGPLDVLRRFAVTDLRRWSLRRWKGFSFPQYGEEYVLYPLHVEPELSLLLLGQEYLDQVAVVDQMAKSLPIGLRLYVKEHPSMFGLRPKSFYERLLRMPNVTLIHPEVDSHEVIRGARLVATVTGTVGLEALLLGKPVVTLGRAYYGRLDIVWKADSLAELPSVMAQALESRVVSEERVLDLVAAIFEGSVGADYGSLWHMPGGLADIWGHPHLDVLTEFLACEMGLHNAQAIRS